MRELQQVTTTVPDAAKRCLFYRVELLNEGKYRTRGKVPPDRRKRGKDGRSGKGGKVEEREQRRWKKGGFVGITAKNGNIAKAGDFRLFAARCASFLWRQSFVLLLFVYQNVTNRKQ